MITPSFPVPPDSKVLLDQALQAADLALAQGAHSARVGLSRTQSNYLQVANGELERLEQSTRLSLSLQLFVEGRYSAHSTSDLRPEALKAFVQSAVGLTRVLQPDPERGLPPEVVYQHGDVPNLALEDGSWGTLSMSGRQDAIRSLVAVAGGPRGEVIRVECGVSDELSEYAVVNTNGFAGVSRGTRFSSSITRVGTEADGRRVNGGAWYSARTAAGLPAPQQVSDEAARRLQLSLGARPMSTRKLPMIIENRAAGRLLMSLVQPMSAYSLQQRQSCLEGKLGQGIGSSRLTLLDEPYLEGGLGSRLFDGEGIPSKPRVLFQEGVLRSYLVDTYYGKKLGMLPNGSGLTNVVMPPGSRSLEALWAEAGESILVRGFLGGNSNPTTGDFSLGISGQYRSATGETRPVTEMNVAGNLLNLWRSLDEVGNDPWLYSSFRLPSLRFGPQVFSGV